MDALVTGKLLDTTVLIDLSRGNSTAAEYVDSEPRHGHSDALIAATAVTNNLELASDNVRHFAMIPDLRLQRPY